MNMFVSFSFDRLGERAMKEMAKSTVFISSLGGLGVEIAKCVALG